jgi:hypothetical protein
VTLQLTHWLFKGCFDRVFCVHPCGDDDGYVIRWWRAMIPSNSLAAIYAIAADCAERRILGPEVAITIARLMRPIRA